MEIESVSLERVEKASSLIRNIVLTIGALSAFCMFVMEQFSEPVSVFVNTFRVDSSKFLFMNEATYLKAENESMALRNFREKDSIGRLASLTDIAIRNTSGKPVQLEVRLPKKPQYMYIKDSEPESNFSKVEFSTYDVRPTCSIDENEITKNRNDRLAYDEIGIVKIAAFPPDCSIYLEIVSTDPFLLASGFENTVEVFSDGKRANIKRANKIYGVIGSYAYVIQEKGALGIVLFIFIPIFLIVFVTLFAIEVVSRAKKNPRKKNSKEEENINNL